MEATPPPFNTAPPALESPKSWHRTLGTIAIIFGSLGLLQGVIAPFTLLIVERQMQAAVKMGAEQEAVDSYLAQLKTVSYLGAATYFLLGILLLVGGILLLRKRSASATILKIWAVLKIAGGAFILFKNSSLTKMQMELMFSSQGKEAEVVGSIATYAVWFGIIFGMIWLCALPIFLLVWFNRSKIKQDIATW
jgi:cytochrome c biogenesis protein CcdA